MRYRVALISAALAAILAVEAPLAEAAADPSPTVTFGASVTNANGTLSTTLNWNTSPSASGCAASGAPSWTGAKAASGSVDLPTITLSGTYNLTLTCTWPGDNGAVLTWTAPTLNTDGTSLTNLAGFKVYHGLTPSALTDVRTIASPTTLSYTFTGLAVGLNYFAMTATTATGQESALSAVGNKTITASVQKSAGVTLTVNPIPNKVGGFAIDGNPVP